MKQVQKEKEKEVKSPVNKIGDLPTFIKGNILIIGYPKTTLIPQSKDDNSIIIVRKDESLSQKDTCNQHRFFYEQNKRGYIIEGNPTEFNQIKGVFEILNSNKLGTLIILSKYEESLKLYQQFTDERTNIIFVNEKEKVFTLINKKPELISVFQIYHNNSTINNLEKGTIPYINISKDNYYENSVIQEVRKQNINSSYIGVTSPKQFKKTGLPIEYTKKLIELNPQVDIFTYSSILEEKFLGYDIWQRHKQEANDIYKLATILNKSKVLPFDLFEKKWVYCLGNYWIARKEIFDWYTDTVLTPTLSFLDNNKEVFNCLKYEHRGYHEHTVYAFLLEGLFGSFLANTQYKHEYVFDTFELIKIYKRKGATYNHLISPKIEL